MYVLYGMPGSLYTAKARSYLRKQAVPFRERTPAHPDFQNTVLPACQRWIIPVLQTPDGGLIQDGAAIMDHFEARGPRLPATPPTPAHEVVARLLELFGGEGLLRPAMHYRWSFDDTNLAFLQADFLCALAPDAPPEMGAQVFAAASGRMRKAAIGCGVTPESMAAIESSYAHLLERLEAHFAIAPYLLGGRPTLGDYGFIGAMYAHLGRDPYPAQLMKRTAPRVWRWVERMNAPEQNAPEFHDRDDSLFPDDAIPETLAELLRFIAIDYLPELEAAAAFANAWLAERPDLPAGTNGLPRAGDRSLGIVRFPWRGVELAVGVLPYRFWLLQRVQEAFARANTASQAKIASLLGVVGLERVLTLQTSRRVERVGNLEVWGPAPG